MSTKTFVCGDIHGCYDQFKACLETVNFDYNNDILISLGDIVDRGNKSFECVEELLKIKNLIAIKGNHDWWWYDYIKTNKHQTDFLQGGVNTLESYIENCNPDAQIDNFGEFGYNTTFDVKDIPISHINFFKNQINYYIDDKNRLFVHGGIRLDIPLEKHSDSDFYWGRDLIHNYLISRSKNLGQPKSIHNFSEIYIGHTCVQYYYGNMEDEPKPEFCYNLINLDCGAGKFRNGRVCLMNVDTKKYVLK